MGGAVKVDDERAIPAIADPRSRVAVNRVVLLDTAAAVDPRPLDSLPPAVEAGVRITAWEPGSMVIDFSPVPPQDGYLVVAENYYPSWRASVDDRETPVFRGDVSLITVPVPAGARQVTLRFESMAYSTGRLVSLVCVVIVLAATVAPPVVRRARA